MATETVKVVLEHSCSIPGARWCRPVDWEPANTVENAELYEGSWWDDTEEVAGLAYVGDGDAYGHQDTAEVPLSELRVASCGDCRVIANEVKVKQ